MDIACVDNSCVMEPLSNKTLACVDNSCVVEPLSKKKTLFLIKGSAKDIKKGNCVFGLPTPFCFSLVLLFYHNVIPRLLISL
jgi:hypothetical protein